MFRRGENCAKQCLLCRQFSQSKLALTRYVDEVVGNSRAILTQHLEAGFFPSARTHVVFNICDPDRGFTRSPSLDGVIRFGYLGRLHPTKGLELLIEQFEKVSRTVPCQLVIAGTGEGEYERSLRALVNNGAVEFLGHKNAGGFLNEIDVLIVPSLWHEPLPRTIIEACSYGVPVIASRRGGNPEIVIDGHTGFLFDPALQDDLRNAMIRIAHDPSLLSRLRNGCIEYSRIFSSAEVSTQYRRVYEEALGTKVGDHFGRMTR